MEVVLQEQGPNTRNEFDKRCNDVIVQFAEQVKEGFLLILKIVFVFLRVLMLHFIIKILIQMNSILWYQHQHIRVMEWVH